MKKLELKSLIREQVRRILNEETASVLGYNDYGDSSMYMKFDSEETMNQYDRKTHSGDGKGWRIAKFAEKAARKKIKKIFTAADLSRLNPNKNNCVDIENKFGWSPEYHGK